MSGQQLPAWVPVLIVAAGAAMLVRRWRLGHPRVRRICGRCEWGDHDQCGSVRYDWSTLRGVRDECGNLIPEKPMWCRCSHD